MVGIKKETTHAAATLASQKNPDLKLRPANSGAACEHSLHLLLDGSNSVGKANWEMQVNATADALESPEVVALMKRNGGMAVMTQKFTGHTEPMGFWEIISDSKDAQRYARRLRHEGLHYPNGGDTKIANAIHSAMMQFSVSPCKGGRKIIDVSTDGESDVNAIASARNEAENNGITINGIGVEAANPAKPAKGEKSASADPALPERALTNTNKASAVLRQYAKTANGFVMDANWDNYARMIRNKIMTEIAEVALPEKKAHSR